jgi:hypothetical protein
MRSYKITVTATPQILIESDNLNRVAYIGIVGNESVAVGNSSVTFGTGLILEKHTAPIHIDVPLGETLWAVCDAGKTDDVRVLLPNAD